MSPSCDDDTHRWKWVTRRRLFNLGSSLCLGLTTGNTSAEDGVNPTLGVYTCSREPHMVRWTWHCSHVLDHLNSNLSMKVLLAAGKDSALTTTDVPEVGMKWQLHGEEQDLCTKSYHGELANACFFPMLGYLGPVALFGTTQCHNFCCNVYD
jgi:hypothetical protein